MKSWFVIRTRSRMEEKASYHLKNQSFNVFLPLYRKKRRHARRIDEVLRPLFPGYLFVQLDPKVDRWLCIRSTVGVVEIVSAGNEMLPVPAHIMEQIFSRADENGIVSIQPTLRERGCEVKIIDGALTNVAGLFEEMDGESRAVLLLNFLGRTVRVSVDLPALSNTIYV